jgi:hypothetical protein
VIARLRLVVAVGFLALAPAGCASEAESPDVASKPPRAILSDVAAALEDVESYHIDGTWIDEQGLSRATGDVTASGTMRITLNQEYKRIELLLTGSETFMRGNREFWVADGDSVRLAAAEMLSDRWVKVPPAAAASMKQALDGVLPETLAYCVTRAVGTISRKGTRQFSGNAVVVLADEGDRPGTSPGEVYVAASGPALPLRLLQTGPVSVGDVDPRCGDTGSNTTASDFRLSDFNEPVHISAPSDALDLAKLQSA